MDKFRLNVLAMDIVFLSDVESIEEAVTNDPGRFTKDFSAIPTIAFVKELFGDGLFFANTDDESWIIPHAILKAPFSTQGVKSLLPMMSEQADLLVKCLQKEVGIGSVCHIDHWVTKMAFETIAVCATGTSFGSFEDAEDSEFIRRMNKTMESFKPLQMCPPKLWPIFCRKRMQEMRDDMNYVHATCIDIVRKRRAKETQHMSQKRDILDMMLDDKDAKSGKRMTDQQIVDNVLTFLFAGQDSTAAAMATLMCYLNAYPHCKEKLVKEIDTVVGNGEIQWDHIRDLRYLDWCIKEAMRLVPPAGAVMRTAKGDQLLQGKWKVRDGDGIMVGIMAVHYDKKLWGDDASEFRPERWENGPPHKYAFMPFAVGPRACTGREFTVIEQKITFVKLLQNFDFRRPANVAAQEGYTTLKKENQTYPPYIYMDVEFKTISAFVGLFSAFELLERPALRQ